MKKGKCNKCFYFDTKTNTCFINLLRILIIKRPGTYGCKKFESLVLVEQEIKDCNSNYKKDKVIMEKKTVWYAQYYEIDKLVNDNFSQVNGKYECLAYEEYGNDEAHTFNIDPKTDPDEFDVEELNEGKFHFKLHLFLNELARMGKLPFTKGELVLEVSY